MMIRQPISRTSRIVLGLACIFLLVAVYSWLSWRQHQFNPNDTTVPSWRQLKDGLLRATHPDPKGDIWLWEDLKATSVRLVAGISFGVFVAVALGLLMGCYPPVESFFLPPLAVLAKIPPTAMLAVFFVIVGTGFEYYISMIAFGIIPTLSQTVYEAAKKDVPDELIYKSYTLGASQAELIWNVIYKHILPKILEAARLQIGPSMVYLLAAEYVVGSEGFGYRIKLQGHQLHMDVVYVYLAILGVAGFCFDQLLITIRRKICPWYAP